MDASECANWRFSIEDAASRAMDVAGSNAVQEVFSLYGAGSSDDLSVDQFEAVLSELVRLAAD